MERKLKITTGKQFQTLISELEKNPYLAKGFHGVTSAHNLKQDWDGITEKLNSLGPPVRDVDGWLKVWRDYKCKVKRKILQKEAEINTTGDGISRRIILNPLEESVANLMFKNLSSNKGGASDILYTVEEIKTENMEEIKTEIVEQTNWDEEEDLLSGNQSAAEEMKNNYYIMDQTFLGDEEDLPSTSGNYLNTQNVSSTERKKRKRNRRSDERQELLVKHNAMQKRLFNEISDTLIELKDILKETSRYQQKMFEVQEKKLKLMEKRNEREEQLKESEMNLKLIELKIKTKELEALEKRNSH